MVIGTAGYFFEIGRLLELRQLIFIVKLVIVDGKSFEKAVFYVKLK